MKRIIGYICLLICCILPLSFAQIKVTKENGISLVKNPSEPMEKKVKELKLIEEANISCSDESLYNFDNEFDYQIDNNQNIYLVDTKNYTILKFNKDGKLMLSFGRKGEGPGEFYKINSFKINNNNQVIVYDRRNLRLNYFSSDGKFIESFNAKEIRTSFLGNHWFIVDGNDNLIFYDEERKVETQKSHRIYRLYSKKGAFIKNLIDFEFPIAETKFSSFNYNEPNLIFNSGKFIVLKSGNYEFEIIELDGRIDRKVSREYEHLKLHSSTIDQLEKSFNTLSIKHSQDIENIFTIKNDEIWVKNSRNSNMFDVFNFEGKFIKQYSYSNHFNGILRWQFDKETDKLYCYLCFADKDGYSQFKRFRVELK